VEYVKLGGSGLEVSRVCLGCMSFGKIGHFGWGLEEADSSTILKRALDLGVSFFDTANCYSQGASEEILGRFIKDNIPRDDAVLATKVFIRMREGPNGAGLSRKAIFREIDASLKRLNTDYVDLYIIHRWDYGAPIEETMEALHDIVKAGKARYIGASAMYAWQFHKAQNIAERHGWTRFISMQNHYNLIYREDEREMTPLLADLNVASTPYSPLAGGRLTRPIGSVTYRSENDAVAVHKYDGNIDIDRPILERLNETAEKHGVPRARIALAWLLAKPPVVSPVIGATKAAHVEDAVAALDVKLSPEEIAYLEEPYRPHPITGALPYNS
jgi:aryl-alcohol dehydrogenase-like predicted oxidoreductase